MSDFPDAAEFVSNSSNNGQRVLTPIIAGTVCGTCVFLAWTIALVAHFVKAYRKSRYRLTHDGADPEPPNRKMERFIVPPDPAFEGLGSGRRSIEGNLETLPNSGDNAIEHTPTDATAIAGISRAEWAGTSDQDKSPSGTWIDGSRGYSV